MYIQRKMVDVQKKNILANLELRNQKFLSVVELLEVLKREFRRGDNKLSKVVKLKQPEQDPQTMDKFVQMFR